MFVDILSDDLLAIPPVQILGAAVPVEDLALLRADDDRVVGKFEQFGLLAQLLVEAVLVGDVHADAGALPLRRARWRTMAISSRIQMISPNLSKQRN